jgi:protein tyrosine/serine phosphatase
MRNVILGMLITALLIAGPLLYKNWQDAEYRNFRIVEDGVLYRSGQLPIARLERLVSTYRIRTIVNLREGSKDEDKVEEDWAKARGLHFVRIPPPRWSVDANGTIPADAALAQFRKVMDDPANYPVLVHCFAGQHRTGAMCAVFRMDYQGWSNADALAEMRLMGYDQDHEDVFDYLSKYKSPRPERMLPALPAGRQNPPRP